MRAGTRAAIALHDRGELVDALAIDPQDAVADDHAGAADLAAKVGGEGGTDADLHQVLVAEVGDGVVAEGRALEEQVVVAAAGRKRVVAGRTVEGVDAGEAVHLVVAAGADEAVVAGRAREPGAAAASAAATPATAAAVGRDAGVAERCQREVRGVVELEEAGMAGAAVAELGRLDPQARDRLVDADLHRVGAVGARDLHAGAERTLVRADVARGNGRAVGAVCRPLARFGQDLVAVDLAFRVAHHAHGHRGVGHLAVEVDDEGFARAAPDAVAVRTPAAVVADVVDLRPARAGAEDAVAMVDELRGVGDLRQAAIGRVAGESDAVLPVV